MNNVLPVCNWQDWLTTGGHRKFRNLSPLERRTCRLQTGSTLFQPQLREENHVAEAFLLAINFAAMADAADDNFLQLRVREKEHALVAHANAEAIPVLQFLAAGWEGIPFQRQDGLGDAKLNLRMKAGQFLARIAGDVDLPAHALMPSSFNACRNG